MPKIQLGSECERLIQEYSAYSPKYGSDWSRAEFSEVRSQIKKFFLEAQDYTCYFCRQRFVVDHNRVWDIEHILSRSDYPEYMFEPENLCVICPICNAEKGADRVLVQPGRVTRFPRKSKAYRICHPHYDAYEDHIDMFAPGSVYHGISEKGRATVRLYGLDRFLVSSGRQRRMSPALRRLIAAAETGYQYEERQMELLEELLIENSDNLKDEGLILSLIRSIRDWFVRRL